MDKQGIERLDFEDTYARLEKIIQKLEEGQLSLDESVNLYEEGMTLAQHCGRKLDDAELRITEVLSAIETEIERDSTEPEF